MWGGFLGYSVLFEQSIVFRWRRVVCSGCSILGYWVLYYRVYEEFVQQGQGEEEVEQEEGEEGVVGNMGYRGQYGYHEQYFYIEEQEQYTQEVVGVGGDLGGLCRYIISTFIGQEGGGSSAGVRVGRRGSVIQQYQEGYEEEGSSEGEEEGEYIYMGCVVFEEVGRQGMYDFIV